MFYLARSQSPHRVHRCPAKNLFCVVAAWEDYFTDYVVDYGTSPDQKRLYFTLRDARHTLATDGTGLEGSIHAGLESITAEYYFKTEGRGRTVDEWKVRPEQPDKH